MYRHTRTHTRERAYIQNHITIYAEDRNVSNVMNAELNRQGRKVTTDSIHINEIHG